MRVLQDAGRQSPAEQDRALLMRLCSFAGLSCRRCISCWSMRPAMAVTSAALASRIASVLASSLSAMRCRTRTRTYIAVARQHQPQRHVNIDAVSAPMPKARKVIRTHYGRFFFISTSALRAVMLHVDPPDLVCSPMMTPMLTAVLAIG